MFQLIANVLAWFYNLVPNYAAAIALLTLAIMILLTPLTLKSTKSMLELQRLQPEVRRLQQQHKGDRQRLNEEMMGLYKEHKINPLGGCLPLLLQAPVFFILFRVLHALTQVCSQASIDGQASRCLSPALPGGHVPVGNFGASYLDHASKLWNDLASGNTMHALGIDLADSAVQVIGDSFVRGLPYLALVLVVAASSYYQQRQISARQTNQVANPQQQLLLKLMPGLFAVISLTFPAGLIVYFLTSNLYRIAQNTYITRRFYGQKKAAPDDDGKDGAPPAKPKPETSKGRAARPAPKSTPKPAPSRPRPTPTPKPVADGNPPKGNPARGPAARPPSRPNARPSPSKPTPKKKK
jgi:YidC/Oxa1 family membrane protein insertase